ncbi:hypothetical protein KSP39_PZI022235 [Platanthera zijinensis]|uniref:Uncharacterized protein n=1 Tax=Platanthera zijinensis TaxID=2320716 RepID=A0AAP0AVP6_9ASPA
MNARPLLDVLEEDSKRILREVGVLQLFEMPSLPQNISLLYVLVRAFSRNKQAFLIGNNYMKFTVNEVALILGLPNRGKDFTFIRLPCIDLTHKDLIDEIHDLADQDWSLMLESRRVDILVRYLVNVFFFTLKGMKIPASLNKITCLSTFVEYNWPKAIHRFLLSQVDALSQASVVKKVGVNLGYLEGCTTILLVRSVNCNVCSLYYFFFIHTIFGFRFGYTNTQMSKWLFMI